MMRTPDENRKGGVEKYRLQEFEQGRTSPWDVVMLLQDILEADILENLPPRYFRMCWYYVKEINLCHTPGRHLH